MAMWLSIVLLKAACELSLMFILGRGVLGVLIGETRGQNVFWQLLDIAASPALRLTRSVSPRRLQDPHIPLVTIAWLFGLWVAMVKLKIKTCVVVGVNTCL